MVARHDHHPLALAQHLRQLAMIVVRHLECVSLSLGRGVFRPGGVDVGRIAVVQTVGPIVLADDINRRTVLDDDALQALTECGDDRRVIRPIASWVRGLPVAIGAEAGLHSAGAVASEPLHAAHDGPACLLHRIVRWLVRQQELIAGEGRQLQRGRELLRLHGVTQHTEQPDHFAEPIVVHLDEGSAWFAKQNRPGAAERFRVDAVRRKVVNHPRCEHPLATVIAKHRPGERTGQAVALRNSTTQTHGFACQLPRPPMASQMWR